ncbi:TatD DNase family protein [Pancytospora epiphaga]|nr:TatD DNase family protein [Pancytospora epiphaga]
MYIDIAFNASSGEFNNRLNEVFDSAREAGVMPIVVGLDLESSEAGKATAEIFRTVCFVGIHPLHFSNIEEPTLDTPSYGVSLQFSNGEARLASDSSPSGVSVLLKDVLLRCLTGCRRIAGIGECGLDYYRKDNRLEQISIFKAHLELSRDLDYPYFFHCRHAFDDFIHCLDSVGNTAIRGVVHSFDGTLNEAQEFLRRGFYIGINGCSMRTEENVEVLKKVPIERILLETDSPYCLIRKSYFCSRFTKIVKARNNEPKHIGAVVEAVANIKSIPIEKVEEIVYNNTITLFPVIEEYVQNYITLDNNED